MSGSRHKTALRTLLIGFVASALMLPRGEIPPLARIGPFDFWIRPFELRTLPISEWPYNRSEPIQLDGERDADGVRQFRAGDGELFEHPVAQAQYVVNALANYRLSGDSDDLDAAIANAERLLARAVQREAAVFFPYPFDFELNGRGTMRAPWFSGMAQGVALSGFVRLWEVTADPRWRAVADQTFQSFLLSPEPDSPWVTVVDGGLLWFEEYPWVPFDHTVNGHIFAAYGLWDYWRVTGRADAETLLRGALTTSLEIADAVRVPGGVSHYCVSLYCQLTGSANPRYHSVHVGQFRTLFRLTGELRFSRLAELLVEDRLAFGAP
jgi:hypothetical protein